MEVDNVLPKNYFNYLISVLEKSGMANEIAQAHAKKLAALILLSSIKKLAGGKNLNLTQINHLDTKGKAQFLEKYFTPIEIEQMIEKESALQLKSYFEKVLQIKTE